MNPKRRGRGDLYVGVAGAAFIIQVGIIYTGGALLKTGRTWTVDHNAVAYALALDVYARPLGRWLAHFGGLMRVLTVSTLYLETYGPLLFILPVFNKWARLVGIVLFAGLQIGFGLCMTMGVFGAVMISLTLAFLPAEFWEGVMEPLGPRIAARFGGSAGAVGASFILRRGGSLRRRPHGEADHPSDPPKAVRFIRGGVRVLGNGAVGLLLVVMVMGNIENIPRVRQRVPQSLRDLAWAIGLEQTWNMFAPDPQTNDGWFVVAGFLHNGETVDLISGVRPASYDRPASIAGSYGSQIWMAYLISLGDEEYSSTEALSRYLKRSWDEGHSGQEQMEGIEIDYMSQPVLPGPSKGVVVPQIMWQQEFH